MAIEVSSRTLPFDWYVDPAVARLEQGRVFARHWQYVARADQLALNGSFVAVDAAGIPMVLVRGQDDVLRGFVNVCRHRGFAVCEGEGQRETLQCPYHAWTYGLDGSLRSAPRADREPGFDAEGISLAPVAVAEWGPFVFANGDPEPAVAFAEWLGDVPEVIAASGLDLTALSFDRRGETDYACNWKVCAENFLECYHCAIAHPSLSKTIDTSADAYLLETRRWSSIQYGSPHGGGGGAYDTSGSIEQGQFHLLFPNTTVNVMPGRQNLSIGPILPRGPERAYRYLDHFFGPDAEDESWRSDFWELDAVVGAEDRALVERAQRGLGNGIVTAGRLMPGSEQLIAHFQALVAEALAD